jgi:DNA-binding transcriptional LysR family regulator
VPSSVLTVAFVVGVTPGKWARVWAERMPRHPLLLQQLTPEAAQAGIADGSIDLALLRLPVDSDRMQAIPLYEELSVVVAPKDHAIEALDSLTLVDLAGDTVLDHPWDEAVALVAANVGVAIMPQSVARALSRRDVVARLLTDAPTTRIALVWAQGRDDALIEEFIGIVRGRTANSSRGSGENGAEVPERSGPVVRAPKPSRRTVPPGQRRRAPRGR